MIAKNDTIICHVSELYNIAHYMAKRCCVTHCLSDDDFEDMIQDAVYRMYSSIVNRKYKSSKGVLPITYLCAIAKHEIYAFIRKYKRKKRQAVRCVGNLYELELIEHDKRCGRR